MLTEARIEKFRKTIQTRYPDFGTGKLKAILRENPEKVFWEPPSYGMPFSSTFGHFPRRIAVPQMAQLTACCGLIQFSPIIGEMSGLWSLAEYDKVDQAIFALWLNANIAPGYAAIICSTGSPDISRYNASEKILIQSGFVPTLRGYNLCHGPNYITLWALQLTSPDQTPLSPVPAGFIPKEVHVSDSIPITARH